MAMLPAKARVFVLLVCSLGGAVFVAIIARSDLGTLHRDVAACVVLSLLVLVGELRPIVITRGDSQDEITLSTGFALALTFVGALWLALAVLCLSAAVQDLRYGKAAVKLCYNAAQYALALSAAGFAFAAMTGQSSLHQLDPLVLPRQLPAALLAGCVFWMVNTLFIATITALVMRESVARRLLFDLRFQVTTSGLLLTFAPVLALSVEVTVWMLPLLVLPMGAIYASAELAARREGEALHDALTGLPNRALLTTRVKRVCDRTGPGPHRMSAVMLLDLDHFKEINDTLGHHVGDQLLTAVASRITANLRPGDTAARLGGDEFAVLSIDLASGSDALTVGQRLLDALAEPFLIDGVQLDVEGSLGIALHPDHGDRMDLLLRKADIALYAAKVERSCVRLYDEQQDPHTLERLALATDLRGGIERGELFLHHQPKMDTKTGRIVGFEALVRWDHPRHGLLMPDTFLPVVENTGLMGPLTLAVLEMALTAVAAWRRAGYALSIAVNLSARHLTDLSLPQRIEERLTAHGLPAEALVLEVTETLVMTDPGRAVRVLALLRDLGVGLAIDDFGTGYSSLAYLRSLRVHELKIDRSFVIPLANDEDDAVIVRSTIELGHNLGLRVLAEGVEDQVALNLLRTWGCDLVQGYFIGRPMTADAVLPWLAARRPERTPAAAAAS